MWRFYIVVTVLRNHASFVKVARKKSIGVLWCLAWDVLKHCHTKQKDNLEIWVVLLNFSLELEISGTSVQGKMLLSVSSEDFLKGDDFDAVLAIWYFYYYGANASEAIEKIATDEKDYHKCSLGVIVCCIATVYYQ